MAGLNLGVNTRSVNHLDNLMGAKEVVKQCAHLDQGYCEKYSKWCYIISNCETKGASNTDNKRSKILADKKIIEHFGTVWVNVSGYGTFNVYVYSEKKLRNISLGTQKTLSDALKAQREFCKANKLPNKNRHINIKDVIKYEKEVYNG